MKNRGITLVVLSAGIGRRFGGLKQIKPVGLEGEVLVDYSLFDALRIGFSKFVFVIRKDMEEDFRNIVGKFWERRIEVEYAFQEINSFLPKSFPVPSRVKPWGTAHAILVCKDLLNSPFAVINSDDFYGYESLSLVFNALSNIEEEYILISYKLEETLSPHGYVSRAICEVDENLYLLSLAEFHKIGWKEGKIIGYRDSEIIELKGDEQVSMNLFGFFPTLFDFIQVEFENFLKEKGWDNEAEFLLPDLIGKLVRMNKVKVRVIPTPSQWFGITHPEDLEMVRERIKKLIKLGKYPERIQE